ncbi:MAG: hypothetical protein IPH82_26820 [Chloroflexi bacterium]|nr:hypothetical protein [Chloroflexota bacterium]
MVPVDILRGSSATHHHQPALPCAYLPDGASEGLKMQPRILRAGFFTPVGQLISNQLHPGF